VTPRIAGAGICCLDHILTAPQVPWGGSAWVNDYRDQGGGLVATALVACARLGADCELLSLLGNDRVGDEILAGLREENVGADGVVRIEGAESPFSFVHVDERSGERTIFHRRASLENGDWPDLARIAQCDALLIDDYYPQLALAAAKAARANGAPVVADVTLSPQTAEALRYVDVLIAPREFAAKLAPGGDLHPALDEMHRLGPTTAVVTLGAKGWVCSSPEGVFAGSAFKVDVVDTTGAGDAFHGAFAYALARGWETARCAEFASAVAAIKCTQAGGRTGLPSLARAVEFLKERGRMEWSGFDG